MNGHADALTWRLKKGTFQSDAFRKQQAFPAWTGCESQRFLNPIDQFY